MLGDQIRRERLRLAIPILGALLLLNGVIGTLAWQDRQARLEAAALQARLATQIVMQRSEAKLRHLNDLLTGIGEVLVARQGVPAKPDLYVHRLLVRRNALTDGVHWIFLVRPDGFLAESSRQFPVLPVNVADREYFVRQVETWDQGLYLGAPLRARLQGESFIPVSRRVSNDGGLFLGVVAGATHGLRSAVLNHILDTLLSIPSLLLAIIVVAFAGPHLTHAMFAVWLALLPRMVRSVYSMVHDELEKEYVIAARLDGASTLNILWFAILPNITAGLITEITRALSMAILDIAALGFLDLGAQLPSPEWGAMLGDALELIYVAPWTVMLPGAAIMISVLLVNLLGDGVRRAIIAGVE